jgi:hypothetical protein
MNNVLSVVAVLYISKEEDGAGEFDCCGAGGEDNYRSDNEEALVVDAADTLSDNKGRRGGDNNSVNDE